MADIEWLNVSPEFGSAMPHGACNAKTQGRPCGFPRRPDGTCTGGHPAQPKQTETERERRRQRLLGPSVEAQRDAEVACQTVRAKSDCPHCNPPAKES